MSNSGMAFQQISEIRNQLRCLGARPAHEQRILRLWSQAKPQNSGSRSLESFMPAALRQALPQLSEKLSTLLRLQSTHLAKDGSVRWLLALQDGQTVETVGLPRDGVCVSSQVGCAVGCVFCMTGKEGLIRQVGSAEIVAQVAFARLQRVVKKVVFMGTIWTMCWRPLRCWALWATLAINHWSFQPWVIRVFLSDCPSAWSSPHWRFLCIPPEQICALNCCHEPPK
ncbi:MAG: putative dual-specificity methyltransferase RlmN [Pseudomonadota bacterium]